MADNLLPFRPSHDGLYSPPLSRFLPPLPKGVISDWLESHTQTGDLVLDPLGANPYLALEAAGSGRRVVSARNNPILWLLLEVLASAPADKEIRSVISKLLLSRQSGITLEAQLKSIYATKCADCGEEIQPLGYVWDENTLTPNAKVYRCPACGEEGEKPVDENDLHNLERLGNIGLQRTRAFQRVALGGDYEKESIEAALDCYLPRAIFTVMLMVNRLDGMNLDKDESRLLQAILVTLFDDANSLWHWPPRDHRHLQLSVPSRFLEKNLWLSLNFASENWKGSLVKIPITYYPTLAPESGGICLYQRLLADKEQFLQFHQPKTVISVFPRPNQAFWTLSALWSGWLWGRKGASPMRSALSRRRYDWYWFAQAISATFAPLIKKTDDDASIFGLLPESSPNFYLGLLSGMASAEFQLTGAAFRPFEEHVQCEWLRKEINNKGKVPDVRRQIQSFLDIRGEPASFTEILMHSLAEYALHSAIPRDLNTINDTYFRQIQEKVSAKLRDEHFTISSRTNMPGGSRWWLVDSRNCQMPLSERVEGFIREELLKNSPVDAHEIEKRACEQFPGSQTPSSELIHTILDSYTKMEEALPKIYHLKPGENAHERQKDLEEVEKLLKETAKRFKLISASEGDGITWQSQQGKAIYRFFLKTTCEISQFVQNQTTENEIPKVIILPGSRSRLVAFRLRQDPRLSAALEGNWIFLKFRHLRRLAARENLTMELWESLLDGDPIQLEPSEQSPLL
ncbi:MAG TPA: hypothetical protein VMW28_02165 [Pelolinea sp.]|nr:hypothetical protein [Pelolinea sp.]